jgi:subfamily B ATP-binding cassette protein HlyB/CyaB
MDRHMRQATAQDFVWALGSLCALHRIAFDADLLLKEFPPPYGESAFIGAARSLGFRVKTVSIGAGEAAALALPCIVGMRPVVGEDAPATDDPAPAATFALLARIEGELCTLFRAGSDKPEAVPLAELEAQSAGWAYLLRPKVQAANDPDSVGKGSGFGFGWFVPELLKHKRVWRDVLLASLVLQLLALATPLFTQAIIDKVVVHHTQSTLIAIGIGMAVFVVFTALLSWVRQYLVLHTGNRVDAVLGFSVFEHLFKLPPRYFEQRPTGVIAARLHGVETIREFVASAAVTLILDLPFLLICVGVMFWYSQTLTWIAIGILTVIVIASLFMAPIFQARLNEQFLLGARNQAFLTEYVGGIETVKSLQMEPQLRSRYADYLATYLQAGFRTKQIGNTYNVFANTLEQLMTLLILVLGAYTVMTTPAFTIGMLVAFQMFAGKLSQPMLRLVGLWTQFQQASLAVKRLRDVMNAPAEPYRLTPQRMGESKGLVEMKGLSFRYRDDLPELYRDLDLVFQPGVVTAIMGPSGCGKSTLAKLLQGFYLPTQGTIKIDGIDSRHLAANELRNTFGVVPQETVLFSGTLYENLQLANPHASFEQIVQACKMAEIHQVIEQLPKGYQTEIGERGVGLSGGQRQRIAIARALLKRPKVLIFDEATSNLDNATAEAFARTVNQLKGRVGMIFIAHALPKSLQVDEVVQIGQDGAKKLRVMKAEG